MSHQPTAQVEITSPYRMKAEHCTMVFPSLNAVKDHAQMLCAQIHSLMMATYGDATEQFDSMGAGNRDNYLWHVHQLQQQLSAALALICDAKGKP